jgi:LPXTG-motif cell wall-anchored protein
LSANPKLEAAHEYFENKANDITGMIILGAILLIGVGALVYMKFKK